MVDIRLDEDVFGRDLHVQVLRIDAGDRRQYLQLIVFLTKPNGGRQTSSCLAFSQSMRGPPDHEARWRNMSYARWADRPMQAFKFTTDRIRSSDFDLSSRHGASFAFTHLLELVSHGLFHRRSGVTIQVRLCCAKPWECDRAFSQSSIRIGGGQSEEPGLHEELQDLPAGLLIEPPQTLGLLAREAQARHFDVLAADTTEERFGQYVVQVPAHKMEPFRRYASSNLWVPSSLYHRSTVAFCAKLRASRMASSRTDV